MKSSGFTLIELLVCIAILTVLSAIGAVTFRTVRERADMATEVNGAKQLMVAFHNYAADHHGRVLPGYQSDPTARNLNNQPLHFPMDARYPWRLAPYAPSIEGVLLYNGNEKLLDENNRDYLVSVRPNLGMNTVFVGGHYGSGSPVRPSPRLTQAIGKFYVSRMNEAHDASKLVVFASARHAPDEVGNFEVRAPNLLAPQWPGTDFDPDSAAQDYGFMDFRWNGKAVAAMLAGNVEVLTLNQLRDMRYWSNQAAQLNDPDFTIGRR